MTTELLAPALLAKYDGLRVPRYTSFPTAPHFTPQAGAENYRAWLSALDPAGDSASLYLHVPFCRVLCWYCGCHTKIVNQYDPVAAYLDVLKREIALVADALPGRIKVRHIHWGGGTPTMAAPADFEAVMALLRQRFDVAEDAEVAVEIDPRTLTEEMAQALGRAGVNRASLGVQDFDPAVQEAIHRHQPLEVTQRTLDWLRGVGIGHINLDLMYGLPKQTEETCRKSAETALTLDPDRLAVFGYAHVPWMKKHQKLMDEAALPDGQARWRQFSVISQVLGGAGLQPIGLDHFAKPGDELAVAQRAGTLHRNFQGYTTDASEVLLGFGCSSIGETPQGYAQNQPDTRLYMETVKEGRLPIAKGLKITAEDRMRRDLIVRLMCDLGVDLDAVAARHGADAALFEPDLARLDGLAADGLAVVDGHRVTVPEAARPLVRAVAAAFDPYLQASLASGTARHSKAI
ncbi:MAG TPA: oxygen-independent coproporphyrinogen III oxidase [Azospirillaceae bacterium]|nr:oxygen-independent coproporphyrinogen III oxidase [Azospirillaceae bacterium]